MGSIVETITDFLHSIRNYFYGIYCTVERFLYWGYHMRNSYDWDFAYLERMILCKLKRMRKEFKEHGHCMWNQDVYSDEYRTQFRSLQLTIKLLTRICDRSDFHYAINADKKLESKWGSYYQTSTGLMGFKRANVVTEQDKADYHKDCLALYDLSQNIKNRDRKWLFDLICKYGEYWWD